MVPSTVVDGPSEVAGVLPIGSARTRVHRRGRATRGEAHKRENGQGEAKGPHGGNATAHQRFRGRALAPHSAR